MSRFRTSWLSLFSGRFRAFAGNAFSGCAGSGLPEKYYRSLQDCASAYRTCRTWTSKGRAPNRYSRIGNPYRIDRRVTDQLRPKRRTYFRNWADLIANEIVSASRAAEIGPACRFPIIDQPSVPQNGLEPLFLTHGHVNPQRRFQPGARQRAPGRGRADEKRWRRWFH